MLPKRKHHLQIINFPLPAENSIGVPKQEGFLDFHVWQSWNIYTQEIWQLDTEHDGPWQRVYPFKHGYFMYQIARCMEYIGVSKNKGTPKWVVKIMETPIKIHDLGCFPPLFLVQHPYVTINSWHWQYFTKPSKGTKSKVAKVSALLFSQHIPIIILKFEK